MALLDWTIKQKSFFFAFKLKAKIEDVGLTEH